MGAGRLPHSLPIVGRFFRWHNPAYLKHERFWATFLDGDFKWLASERYAGKLYNCGHYFALTHDGAIAEATFYNKSYMEERVLLEVSANFESVLDLSDLGPIRAVLSRFHQDPMWPLDRPFSLLLQFLVDQEQGGNSLTSDIGRWAWEAGYDGILFYSARSLRDMHWEEIRHPNNWDAFLGVERENIDRFRHDRSILNLVILSGMRLTTQIENYRVADGEWRSNPYLGLTVEEMNRIYREHGCEFGSSYQAEMGQRGILTGGPTIVRPVIKYEK